MFLKGLRFVAVNVSGINETDAKLTGFWLPSIGGNIIGFRHQS